MNSGDLLIPSPICELADAVFEKAGVRVFLKRDDLIHSEVSGNKWRKLKYNLAELTGEKPGTVISFGGAYSNHLAALASLGSIEGIRTIGIVRGDELTPHASPTLRHCASRGMELRFVSRGEYREKEHGALAGSLLARIPDALIIPEGGTNHLALKGVGEIPDECADAGFSPDFYVVPAGTGGTTAGLLLRACAVVSVAVLKNAGFLREDIGRWIAGSPSAGQLDLQLDYHFGGYGRYDRQLIDFIAWFEAHHGVPLEQVYTGKMFYGLYDLIKRGYFAAGTTLMVVHTGGLQGKFER